MSTNEDSHSLTRQELYDLVWQTPMRLLAPRFGLSDVGLAKICAKCAVPRPPVGYWAKVAAGKKVRQPALPISQDVGADDRIMLFPSPPKPDQIAEGVEEAFFDAEAAALARELRTGGRVIPISETLHGCHALTTRTRRHLEHRDKPPRRDQWGGLVRTSRYEGSHASIQVSKDQVHRALLLLDAVVKTLVRIGTEIVEPQDRWDRSVRYRLLGHDFNVRIRELNRQVPHVLTPEEREHERKYGRVYAPKHDLVPRGDLVVEAIGSSYRFADHTIRDSQRRKVEEQLLDLALGIVRAADRERRRRAEEIVKERQRLEMLQRQREEEERRRVAEALHKQEMDRRARLAELADRWRRAEQIRCFIAECRERLSAGDPEPASAGEMAAWFDWADGVAVGLDPFTYDMGSFQRFTHPEGGPEPAS